VDSGVSQVLFGLLGAEPISLQRLTMGYSSSRTYLVEVADSMVVVKVSDDPCALANTAQNIATLARLDIPVPTVLGYDDSQRHVPGAVLVMSRIGGRDLRHELPTMTKLQMSTLAHKIVEFQRRAATVPPVGSGCGFVGVAQPAERSWIDVVRHPNGYRYADPLPGDTAGLVPRLWAAIDMAAPYLSEVRPVCFLDDLTTKNVMMCDGELSGVVDFDCVAFGDPLFHLGLTAAAVTADVPGHCRFYVDELIRLSDASYWGPPTYGRPVRSGVPGEFSRRGESA
jgi:aminoglycoside phosphotransferase (APT) family kinase protein